MTKENMDSRRRRYDTQSDRHEMSHSHKVAPRKPHQKDNTQPRHNRKEKDLLAHPSDQNDRRNRRDRELANRREWRRRNSPIELVPRHESTDDSSSSSSSSSNEEPEDRRNEQRRAANNRKREREESFEELSRRKRKIESELNALDAEEAAAKEEERKHRNHSRNHSDHKKNHSSHHRDGRNSRTKVPERSKEEPVRIKKEPSSDEERRRKKSRPTDVHRQRDSNRTQETGEEWGQSSEAPTKPKEKPNFKTSGKLAEDTNTYNGVVIKYNEPSEARRPKRKWRLYPFKGPSDLPFIPVHRQSAYLLGRTRTIADIPIDHPSCSKQHAVLQFRATTYKKDDGSTGRRVRPYIIDLESANGTFVNNKKVDPRCYVELLERDVLKFGFSTREYVILHEDSKHEGDDIDST